MPDDIRLLIDRIRHLLDESDDGAPASLLAEIEHTLTDGYAHALALEAEGLRLGREIGSAVQTIVDGDGPPAEELGGMAERLSRSERDLARLRKMLERLRDRAEVIRRSVSNGAARPDRSGLRTPQPGYGFRSAAS